MNLLAWSSHVEIGLCWYQKDQVSMWTYDITNHVMIDLDIVIALVIITFMEVINFYELSSNGRNSVQRFH